jgi:(1->4)-alpha-D-glucan 1-alpha-D-glucosylmutase
MSTPLDALCALHGVASEYTDIWGETQPASDETRCAILKALGVIEEGEDLERAAQKHLAEAWREIAPPAAVFCVTDRPYRLPLKFHRRNLTATYRWSLTLEDGARYAGEFRPADLEILKRCDVDGEEYVEVTAEWRDTLPLGYHDWRLSGPDVPPGAHTVIVVAPERCYLPPALEGGARTWGAALQLYMLRSERNWGIGDFTDLRTAIEHWGHRGAGVLGVNPLHALFPHNPSHTSPYSPSSRLFLNVLYIDVEAIPEARECADVLSMLVSAQFQSSVRAARATELVDYPRVAGLKMPVFERLYRHFREHHLAADTERAEAFRTFQHDGGTRLRQHALFEALQAHFHHEDPAVWGWPVWPEPYRDPASAEVARFADANVERVEFFEYLQWNADQQLAHASRRAVDLNYAVGMYQDLAISIDRAGAESWANQDVYAVGASVGAPPDEVNLKGQNWGLPPLRPERLRATGYAPFIATLRANMRHAGALRIDHVMGLYRLYWIPPGFSAAQGAYVAYPFQDLLGILALESHRNRCMVIGEDLGTVPDEVREGLERARVMSYRLLFFERTESGDYKKPEEYPVDALVAASTHDLATLTGFWEGHDLEMRRKLHLFPSEEIRERYVVNRASERARLAFALEREKLLPAGESVNPVASPMTAELARAVHIYLAKTPSRLLVVQPEDILGVRDQANMPGTVEEQPNWRRKLPLTLEQMERDPRFVALAEALGKLRPAREERRAARAAHRAVIPRCTYRLQLNSTFTFRDATALIPYLARLGVSHVYCSPYLRARKGSTHGYDIIDHNALNPEIGTEADFEQFVKTLREHDMGHILDMVPNHMGVLGADNAWWLDVLENGPASAYADFFDIEWQPANASFQNKVLIPVLGDQYGLVLERGELKLMFNAAVGELSVAYYDHRFPIDPREYPLVLKRASDALHASSIPADTAAEFASLCSAFANLPGREDADPERRTERQRNKDVHKRHLARLAAAHGEIARAVEQAVSYFNGNPPDRTSFERMHELLERQAYRLSSWRVAADEINYRRFFDINDLAALRMENEQVFEATHRFVLTLAAAGKIDGLRIDHPDGLYDPEQYFRRLQQRYAQLAGIDAGPENGRPARPLYLIIEKIAAGHERLPESWAVHGTSGYRFATAVNAVLVDHKAADEMERVYRGFAPDAPAYPASVYEGKITIMRSALASPLLMLATELLRIARADRRTRDYTLNHVRYALAEFVACFPVYRTYILDKPSAQDRRYIDWAIAQARRRSRFADTTIYEFVRNVLLNEPPADASAELKERVRAFAIKMQQFTAPVTAKGIEDTAFYRYNRLASLNDVAGDPSQFGMPLSGFHGSCAERGANRPHTMLATSTHDNKRSEDVRARIDVLSEMPEDWRKLLRRWDRVNRPKKTLLEGEPAPSANDEYLLYQVLLGTFTPETDDDLGTYCERIETYMLKAIREAKVHTSWIAPNAEYEGAVSAFVRALLAPDRRNLFLKDLRAHAKTFAWFGMLNSLTMTLLKLTCPGVPDIYQGNETVDLSLVDPDNRRPVDYARRAGMLDELEALARERNLRDAAEGLASSILDGRAKTWMVWRTLAVRRAHREIYDFGQYVPLHVSGAHADHVIAFMRRHGGKTAVTIGGRLWMKLGGEADALPLGEGIWGDTAIDAGPLGGAFENVYTGERVRATGGKLLLSRVFTAFPAALLLQV